MRACSPRLVARWALAACAMVVLGACASAPGSAMPEPDRDAAGASRDVAVGAAAPEGDGAVAAQGEPCRGRRCAPGLTCRTWYGIAGPRGPAFSSCEIPCGDAAEACPEGQACVTIADGPGRVCRKR